MAHKVITIKKNKKPLTEEQRWHLWMESEAIVQEQSNGTVWST